MTSKNIQKININMQTNFKEPKLTLNDLNTTYLSPKDWEHLHKLITNPPKPNNKLKKLLSE